MPKEYIGTAPQEHGSVAVSWGKDSGHISVSVAGPVGWRDEELKQLVAPDTDNGLDWHFQAMNRWELNRLIRTLRKARDQAFGKDE